MTRTARIAKAFAASVVAALALCAAATAGGPTISAGYGCAVACIESALVTPTASSASVEVKTSVPASVTVTAATLDAELGLATGTGAEAHLRRTVPDEPDSDPLRPRARDDLPDRRQREGPAGTRADALRHVHHPQGEGRRRPARHRAVGRARLQGRLHREGDAHERSRRPGPGQARAREHRARDIPGQPRREDHRWRRPRPARPRDRPREDELHGDPRPPAHRHDVLRDGEGDRRAGDRPGWSRARSARARRRPSSPSTRSRSSTTATRAPTAARSRSASVQTARPCTRSGSSATDPATPSSRRCPGRSRPGVWNSVSIDRQEGLDLFVGGDECDWQRLSKCPHESGGNDYSARATTAVDLRKAFVPDGALPAAYGTGLPAATTHTPSSRPPTTA